MVHHKFTDEGYILELTIKDGYAFLCGVNMGKVNQVTDKRIGYCVELEMAEQMIKNRLYPFTDDLYLYFCSKISIELDTKEPHQVTDDVPFFGFV